MAEVLLFHHAQGRTEGFKAFADELRRGGHTVHTPDPEEKALDGLGWPRLLEGHSERWRTAQTILGRASTHLERSHCVRVISNSTSPCPTPSTCAVMDVGKVRT